MAMQFSKATKKQARLRLALIGVSGSGKTYTALTLARELGERVAVIDTERGSASKYADLFAFDVLELETYSPTTYVEAIKAAEAAGYQVLVIDSLSHAWMGKDGALEQVDRATAASRSGNSYVSWRTVTPQHNALVDAMLQTRCHVIATMRAKSDFVEEVNEKTGKKGYRKVGLAPIQRDGMEYEFDLVGDMDLDNNLIISKTRCPALHGAVISKPGKPLADTLRAWLTDGAPIVETTSQQDNGNGKTAELESPPDWVEDAATETGAVLTVIEPLRQQPELLKSNLNRKAQTLTGEPTKEQKGIVVAALETALSMSLDPRAARKQLLVYLFGKDSMTKLTNGEVLALRAWLNPQKDNGGAWSADPMAAREAVAAFNAAQPPQAGLL